MTTQDAAFESARQAEAFVAALPYVAAALVVFAVVSWLVLRPAS